MRTSGHTLTVPNHGRQRMSWIGNVAYFCAGTGRSDVRTIRLTARFGRLLLGQRQVQLGIINLSYFVFDRQAVQLGFLYENGGDFRDAYLYGIAINRFDQRRMNRGGWIVTEQQGFLVKPIREKARP